MYIKFIAIFFFSRRKKNMLISSNAMKQRVNNCFCRAKFNFWRCNLNY